ncbi:MAG TPA: hypothetical protein VHE58_01335 [Burkholderiales bacterium]|nr:hypothetical protein [Burkholderiales bacterium]
MNWDTLLKVWAVLGPLIAAAAIAFWSRHTQVKDRDYEHSRESERLNRADTAKKQDHNRALRVERYNEIKGALADLMASSHEYVRKQSEYITKLTPDMHQAASQANDKFVYSCQLVTLLGDEPLTNAAVALWNATLEMPKSYNIPIDQAYEQKLVVYRDARAEFNDLARKYLNSLDAQDD